MVRGKKKIAIVVLIAVVSVTLIAWAILRRPTRQVMPKEEICQSILEYPLRRHIHFEAKSKTIEFLSFELMPVEESLVSPSRQIVYKDGEEILNMSSLDTLHDKVWIVEYECEGRVIPIPSPYENDPPPFMPTHVQEIMDAYTGQLITETVTFS